MIGNTLLAIVGIYAALGVVFSIAFLLRAAPRLDPAFAASPRRVRFLFIPGCAAVWPLLAIRWLRTIPEEGS